MRMLRFLQPSSPCPFCALMMCWALWMSVFCPCMFVDRLKLSIIVGENRRCYTLDAVFQISANLHGELYSRLRGDDAMCEALRELMADDLKEAESKGIEKGIEKRDYQKIMEMLKDGKTPEAIVEFCKYQMEQVLKVQEEILVQK